MIDGLHFDVTAEELHAHLLERLKHHEKRAKFYEEQAASIDEARGGEDDLSITYSNSMDPRRQFTSRAQSHRRKVDLFAFMAAHVIKSETYRLTEHDLREVEFIEP